MLEKRELSTLTNNRNKMWAVEYSCNWKEDPTIAADELTVYTCVKVVKGWKKGEEDPSIPASRFFSVRHMGQMFLPSTRE